MSLLAHMLQWARGSAVGARLKRKIKTEPALQPLFKVFSQRIIDYRFPRTFNTEPTNACNLKCCMCPRDKSPRKIGHMEWELFEKIVEEAAKYGPRNFTLHKDGEPLMHKRIVDMVRLIRKSHPMNTSYISTNGLLLRPELSEALIESGLDILHFSIGASRPETYRKVRGADLERVEENVMRFLELKRKKKSAKPDVAVQIIVMEDTRREIREFLQKWRRRGVTVSVPGFLTWSGAVDDITLKEIPRVPRYPCHSLWTAPSVNWDGTVSLCCVDWEAAEILGDLNVEPLADVWNSDKIRQYRTWHLAGEWDRIPVCRNCNYWQEVPDLFFSWQKRRKH
ncbi:MAG: radical SAM/SPASM domain-containing protein [Planctomycetota bacterium]|jgi:MoaA/NifB/PqqE/SkfB family radical SAM enzyme